MYAGFHPDFFWDGDRVLRHARGARKLYSRRQSPGKCRGDEEHHPKPEQSRETGEQNEAVESSSAATASLTPDSSRDHIATNPPAAWEIDSGDIDQLKRQLADAAKLIEHLTSKVEGLENKGVDDASNLLPGDMSSIRTKQG